VAVRDLIRVREEVKRDRRIARQRIRSFLMRYGKRYPGPRDAWSHRFEVWARSVTFDEPLATEAFANLLSACFIRDAQLAEMGRRIEQTASRETFATDVARLSALRGISTLSAMTILAETCDFYRFPDAKSYMGFTGLTPSEHSSGASRHQGSITKTGNRHIRRVLVESAWAYRHAPAVRGKLRERLEGMPPEIAAYSWTAQVRLNPDLPHDLGEERGAYRGRGDRTRALRVHLGPHDRQPRPCAIVSHARGRAPDSGEILYDVMRHQQARA
jgi:Transposase and inactivated derivatives